jgi:CubicO group peptidase (beta-lactamase class C family)
MFRSRSATTIFKAAGAGLLTAILCSCTGAASSEHKIAKILQQYHQNDKFSGAALVGYGDKVVYEGAFGLADETWKIANTPATRFQIGSLTKQFTAALILERAQQGRLDLDATLSTYLPDYRRDVADAATPQEVIGKYCSNALEFTPGTQFKYSNCGYLILGALYERVTGETYADGLRRLTARAGLTDTSISGPRAIVPRLATAYVVENGQQIKAPYIDWSVAFSSGAAYSTVRDLWRWRGELLSCRVLGAEGTKEVLAIRQFGYSFGWHVGRTSPTQLRTFLASDYDAQPAPERAHLLLASHSGDLPGFHSCMTLFLDRTWTVILLDNHDSKSLPSLAAEIMNALLTGSPEARSTSAP